MVESLAFAKYGLLSMMSSTGMSQDEILEDFPKLTKEDIRACLTFTNECEYRLTAYI